MMVCPHGVDQMPRIETADVGAGRFSQRVTMVECLRCAQARDAVFLLRGMGTDANLSPAGEVLLHDR